MLIDTHAHAYYEGLSEREEEVITNMEKMGVDFAVQIGCRAESAEKSVALARKYPNKYRATVGLHPDDAKVLTLTEIDSELSKIRAILEENRDMVVAIWETGWDFFRLSEDSEAREKEIASERYAFEKQCALAKEFDLPLVIHTRNSGEATLESLREFDIRRAVVHCFSEDLEFAKKAMEISDGILFWFSGILTYKNAKNVQAAAASLPLDKILVETDAPFLAPEPVRWTVNESANVRHVLERLKTLRTEDGDTVEKAVFENSLKFYSIPLETIT